MDAIVYYSKTGNTKRYAEMLGQKTELPVYTFKEAKKAKISGKVIFMAGIRANSIYKLKKARNTFDIGAICANGLSFPVDSLINDLTNINKISEPFFYLHGGYAPEKVKGFNKLLMSIVKSMAKKNIMRNAKDGKPTPESDSEFLAALTEGRDFVSEDNLTPVIEFINSTNT